MQYPLYSASIQLYGGTLLPYNLKEQTGWSMDLNEITRTVHDARCAAAVAALAAWGLEELARSCGGCWIVGPGLQADRSRPCVLLNLLIVG